MFEDREDKENTHLATLSVKQLRTSTWQSGGVEEGVATKGPEREKQNRSQWSRFVWRVRANLQKFLRVNAGETFN